MNGTFKVVYNKARGALMVVNEITSCVQVKGTKTVIAAAVVAMMAGASGGAYAVDPIAKVDDTTFTSIKDALNSGVDGKTISLLGDVTNERGYTLGKPTASGFETTAKNVTIDLSGHSYAVMGAGAGSSGTQNQVFQLLKESENVTFKNGTLLANNSALCMVIQNYSNLTLDHVVVDGTKLSTDPTNSDVSITVSNNSGNVTINNSSLLAGPGAVALDVSYLTSYPEGVSVDVSDTTIDGKIRVNSDAVGNVGEKHLLTLTRGVLKANASELGGKVYTDGYTTIRSVSLVGNSATKCGGAIYNKGTKTLAGKLTVEDVALESNVASAGGAIFSDGGIVSVKGNTKVKFLNNEARKAKEKLFGGGAIYANGATVTVEGVSLFDNNKAVSSDGGALYVKSSNVNIDGESTFSNNKSSTGNGGAIFLSGSSSKVSIGGISKFTGNGAKSSGGAIFVNNNPYNFEFYIAMI